MTPYKTVLKTFWLFLIGAMTIQVSAQPGDLPWDPDPDCNSIVTTGITAVTCGTIITIDPEEQYTFGLIDINGALPPSGRVDVTMDQAMYHHPAWTIDSIGNVFGIAFDNSGSIYLTASSNYSSYFFEVESVIRYGEIGGGANDLNAAGTVYQIDGVTGQPTVFAVLPQQEYSFENVTCEGFGTVPRTTGPGLGNIAYNPATDQFYVTNFEDGRIYRLDSDGNILDSYDPFEYDGGAVGPPALEEITYGITIGPGGTDLFFGNVGVDEQFGSSDPPSIYSIPLQADGSFTGTIDNTVLPAGAAYDNYVGDETLHYTLLPLIAISSVSMVSDLEFSPSGELLVGNRGGCEQTIHTSYSHGGRTLILSEVGGLYSNLVSNFFISQGDIDDENCYGGVSAFSNPDGSVEYVASTADLLSEQGPHGISITPAGTYGSTLAAADPAGVISYIPPNAFGFYDDAKGIGGDVFVFKQCIVDLACPTEIIGDDVIVCGGEPFPLTFQTAGGDGELAVTWTDANGTVVDPDSVVIEHTGCIPDVLEYFVTGVCLEDSTVVLQDTITATVFSSDISDFVTVIEEPCFIDVIIDPDCEGFLTLIGDPIPVINPGDSGTIFVEVVQSGIFACGSLELELSYDCSCTIDSLQATPQACMDGEFMVEVNFGFENVGGAFEVFDQDNNSLGIFNYTDLPVMVGPFLGDPTVTYTISVQDTAFVDCGASIDVGPVNCEIACNATIKNAICSGDTLALIETGGDAVEWLWSSDGAAVISDPTVQNPTATNVANGEVFTVIITAASGLSDSCTVIAEVFDLPACEAVNNGPICMGDELQLDEIGGEAISWSWSSDGGAVISDPTIQNPTATDVSNGEIFTVVITDQNGCTSTCTTVVEVFDEPVCNATIDGPICSGETLVLNEDGGSAVSWMWSTDGGALIDDPAAQSPTATGVSDGETFTVMITDANGCVSSCSVTATVNALPGCNASNDGPICEGDDLGLSEDAGDAISWQWSTDGGAVIDDPTAQNPTATNVSNGETFTVIVTDANGCTDTCTTIVEVFILPVCNAENDGPICEGDELGLSENGGAAVSWSWSSDGAAVIDDPAAQNPIATEVSNGEIFTVVITDANGCTSSCSTTAQVFDLPVCNAENDGPICEGDILGLSENGGDAVSWFWSSDGAAVIDDPTAQNPSASNAADGEVFTVVITDANGCSSSCSTVAEVFDGPEVTASSNSPICEGDILILEADVDGGTAPYTYSWSDADGFISSNANVYIQMTTMDDAGTYEVEVTDANGCISFASTDVVINPNLTDPGEIEGDEYFCGPGFDPAPITEVTPPSGAVGPIEFFWMEKEDGGAWVIIPDADGPTYDPGPIYVTTQYSRCVRIDGCIMALESNIVTKIVGDEAIVDPTGPASPCVDDISIYQVTDQPGATYFWDFGPGATPATATTSQVAVSWSSFGYRNITVTVTTATCTANNFLEVYVSDSPVYCDGGQAGVQIDPINAPAEMMGYKIFPNPFNDRLQVRFEKALPVATELRLSNLQGALVNVIRVPAGDTQVELDLVHLPKGVYMLTMDLGGQMLYQDKVVKQ
jgi:hypothetical protein